MKSEYNRVNDVRNQIEYPDYDIPTYFVAVIRINDISRQPLFTSKWNLVFLELLDLCVMTHFVTTLLQHHKHNSEPLPVSYCISTHFKLIVKLCLESCHEINENKIIVNLFLCGRPLNATPSILLHWCGHFFLDPATKPTSFIKDHRWIVIQFNLRSLYLRVIHVFHCPCDKLHHCLLFLFLWQAVRVIQI